MKRYEYMTIQETSTKNVMVYMPDGEVVTRMEARSLPQMLTDYSTEGWRVIHYGPETVSKWPLIMMEREIAGG